MTPREREREPEAQTRARWGRRRLRRRALATALGLLALACAHRPNAPGTPTLSLEACLDELPATSVSAVPLNRGQLRGAVVLVTFIATWCFPCLVDLPAIERLERDHGAAGFRNVLVGMDLEGALVLAPFAEQQRLAAPLLGVDDRLRDGATPFGRIRELPVRVLFGRDGRARLSYSGVVPYRALERAVLDALAEPPPR